MWTGKESNMQLRDEQMGIGGNITRISLQFSSWLDSPSGPRPHFWGFEITLRRYIFGRTSLDEWSAHRRNFHLTTHNTYRRETTWSPARFEPAIPAGQRPQTHALDRAATGISDSLSSTITTNIVAIAVCSKHRLREHLNTGVQIFIFAPFINDN